MTSRVHDGRHAMRWRELRLGPALCLLLVGLSCAAARAAEFRSQLRRPVAVQLSRDERHLFVANSRSGSISVVQLDDNQLMAEYPVGQRLSDLKVLPSGQELLIT